MVGHILDTPYSIGPDVDKHNMNFNISCRYSWKRDGIIIEYNPYIRFNPLTGMLTIPKFTVRENGIYTCIAMNTINGKEVKAMSPNVKLILQRKSEPNTHTHTHTHTHTLSPFSHLGLSRCLYVDFLCHLLCICIFPSVSQERDVAQR